MKNPSNESETLDSYTYFRTIFDYVRGNIPDDELRQYLIGLIELIQSPRDRIQLFEYLFEEFNYDKKSDPEFCEKYYEALASHFRMGMDMLFAIE